MLGIDDGSGDRSRGGVTQGEDVEDVEDVV